MEIKDTDINPDTGRDRKGRFTVGNSLSPNAMRKRTPVQVTQEARAYAAEKGLNVFAVKMMEKIARNKNNEYSGTEQLRACEALLKNFNISVEKDMDKQQAEDTNATLSEMVGVLKGVAK
ncbi:hypothetical protein SEPB62_19036 [Salmonella enterica subsp. enterica serovar Paratyphi B str. SARA62]|uniref:Uncharacterized protein n=3 Tax=Salmonella enterica TaxID=28901 RepID=A0A753Z953_SALER|nr:hypothetical protein [Salmonella enterica]ECK9403486.1 hypothetical protein [Salmonella enterica subsp. enterica serovar Paratyphi C str. CFSAN000603]QUZ43913.1 hypothetical protein JYM88_12055 [Salmonella enterica subsp. enterica serovar Paratyphi B str. CFSAN000549]HAB6612441.1 hypothetical protein [Salmonella enterica subsp. enterica serovar Paratyphi C]HAE8363022.1 hypothetical protein [Salmonella enterica subsp. enterica serovar Paratyphi B]ESE73115.1 hypothetical protein SEPB62_19036 